MMNLKPFAFILLSLFINSCGNKNNDEKKIFSIDTSALKQVYQLDESVNLIIKNEENKTIDSVVYLINDVKIGSAKNNSKLKFNLSNQKLGYQKINATIFSDDTNVAVTANFMVASNVNPKALKYKIINTYPHDIKAYTQGFEFYRDTLYEGTGNGEGKGTGKRGISSLRKTNYKTGEVYKTVSLSEQYFGEGITILNNKVYQLTWLNNEGYVYNADTFEKIKTFKYFKEMQGWGLTNDGKNLYMSEGSEKIYILDPETLQEVDYINVYTKKAKIEALNELEWIEGKIWANVYGKDALAVINPKNGAVEGILDLKDLKTKVTQHPDVDVLNGIAYNPKTKTVFLTGKNWDKTFEIVLE
ncbi:glutaminyl-peptide cyclotransferase [Flavobacterium jejuense]|uniref:Glutaminyl-peptide cyclotransferase n=1 Tax=Flavobacterium jejuense TaxID=1544455 RepID=A0ABX0IT88_9FLAO|nr:glutaminyl-peptide cyclotransferase [Flavobacterium jejuense]NHN26733.1 glutaminyl-peptide cyclotransferase [Flavobacterium jejuense]